MAQKVLSVESKRALETLDYLYKILESDDFVYTHKAMPMDFTRTRKLDFVTLFILIMRRSVKSLQLILNEFVMKYNLDYTVTNSAFSQARQKLKHTAFKELYEGMTTLYDEMAIDDYKKFLGFRCIAIDASRIILPNMPEITDFFGATKIHTQHGDFGTYTHAMCECAYDMLNNLVVKTSINHCNSYEVDLAVALLDSLGSNDLLIFDRGYAAYEMMANLMQRKRNFIIRLSAASFSAANEMFDDEQSPWSKIVTINVPRSQKSDIKNADLPEQIQIRLVKVILSTGETEVLATSLLDEKYTQETFKELYWLRWGVETFFGKIKGRLNLENFTGKSLESVLQDFWATILLSNLETIVTADAQKQIDAKVFGAPGQLEKNVNKAVSFNVIKNSAFELLFTIKDKAKLLSKLTLLFMTNTCVIRKDRDVPRKKITTKRSLNYQKRTRKHVF